MISRLFMVQLILLAGCVQPAQMVSVDIAEAQCVRSVLDSGRNTVSIGVGTGTGVGFGGLGWDDGWGSGSAVGVSTTIPVGSSNPEAAYSDCVLRKSGKLPDTPLAQRPEIVG